MDPVACIRRTFLWSSKSTAVAVLNQESAGSAVGASPPLLRAAGGGCGHELQPANHLAGFQGQVSFAYLAGGTLPSHMRMLMAVQLGFTDNGSSTTCTQGAACGSISYCALGGTQGTAPHLAYDVRYHAVADIFQPRLLRRWPRRSVGPVGRRARDVNMALRLHEAAVVG
jgi:hypothetical protein